MLDIPVCIRTVPPHPWGGEESFDAMKQPWTYDPDIGVVLAWPDAGHVDGAYVYGRGSSGKLTVLPNPQHGEMDARRLASGGRCVPSDVSSHSWRDIGRTPVPTSGMRLSHHSTGHIGKITADQPLWPGRARSPHSPPPPHSPTIRAQTSF